MTSKQDFEHQLTELLGLIRMMNNADILDEVKRAELWKTKGVQIVDRMKSGNMTYNEASDGPDIFNQSEHDFRLALKEIDNDLAALTRLVKEFFLRYLEIGEIPAPHYAMRIAIILSKRKMKNWELVFLAAWCRHFDWIADGVYDKLVMRFQKLAAKKRGQ